MTTSDAKNPSTTRGRQPSGAQIQAAKLKQITSRRLKKETPEWVDRVARGLPASPNGQ